MAVTRKQVRKIVLIVILLLLLAALIGYFTYYRGTKKLDFNISATATGAITPPEFLYSFVGADNFRMQRPVGVMTYDQKVYVTDGLRHVIYVFNESGKQLDTFGSTETSVPLYLARNPKDGLIYVTDRYKRRMVKFTTDGKYMGIFDPKLPKSQQPKFKTFGAQWIPVAVAFAPDGTMYATEILNGHRLLIFNPDGSFKKSIGTAGIAKSPGVAENYFQFPNGLMVVGKEVYVADSNNGRIQIFDLNGNFKRFIVTRGLPRGIAQLDRFPTDAPNTPGRFVQIDTLAHDATIWTNKGDKILNFGTHGILDGQFNYPDGVAKGTRNKIFIADTANGRVDVWGWPVQVSPVAGLVKPSNAWICLIPLLLMLLPLFFRRKRFVATPDFVGVMIETGNETLMPGGRRRWLATVAHYEEIKALESPNVDMGELFEAMEASESDARAIREKLEVDEETAVILALATRAKVFTTESIELRRLAKLLEVDAIDHEEYVRRYSKRDKSNPPTSDAPTTVPEGDDSSAS